jgi:large subunit ribosomal protein L7e
VDVHPDIRRILAKLRLTQVLTGVFLRATEANLKRLAAVELFVTYGWVTRVCICAA